METYCVSCKKNSANKNSNVKNTEQNGCFCIKLCCMKKLRFIKNQEASGLLSDLGLKTPLNNSSFHLFI